MGEETTTVTAPEWKQKADELNELLKTNPEAGGQVVYRSRQGLNDDPVCVPELVSEKMEANSYPDVVTAPPADMVSPKYSWYGSTGWFENATQQQGTQIVGLEATIKAISQSLDDLKKENQTESTTTQQQGEKMDKLIKLVAMTNTQVGELKKQIATASTVQLTSPETQQPTTTPVSQKPTVSATQLTTPATDQPAAPVTQPTQPSTTTTEGGTQ